MSIHISTNWNGLETILALKQKETFAISNPVLPSCFPPQFKVIKMISLQCVINVIYTCQK